MRQLVITALVLGGWCFLTIGVMAYFIGPEGPKPGFENGPGPYLIFSMMIIRAGLSQYFARKYRQF